MFPQESLERVTMIKLPPIYTGPVLGEITKSRNHGNHVSEKIMHSMNFHFPVQYVPDMLSWTSESSIIVG